MVIDLDQDPNCTSACNEIIACGEACYVFDSTGAQIGSTISVGGNRVYSGHVTQNFVKIVNISDCCRY